VLAATATGTMSVTALVANSCTISNATLDFGTYNTLLGVTKVSSANVNCSLFASHTLTMDQGQNHTGSTNQMKATIAAQTYFLPYTTSFVGAALVGSLLSLSGVGTGLSVPTPITGTVAAAVNVPAGTSTDSVLMTVTF